MVRENYNHSIGVPQALTQITALEQQVLAGGSVDSEKDIFKTISQKLTLGLITPEQAIQEATDLVNKRQEYH
jgi:hypothetical protein